MTGVGVPVARQHGGLRAAMRLWPLSLLLVVLAFSWSRVSADTLRDYGSFVASARAASRGLDPYGVYELTYRTTEAVWPNLNPPISVLAFQPFTWIEPTTGLRIWLVVSVLSYVAALALVARTYASRANSLRLVWAVALSGIGDTLYYGQIYLPLVLVAVGAWLLLERKRYLAAGLLIGVLVAVKPNFAIWPAMLLLAGYQAAALWAFLGAALVSLPPLLVYGPQIYTRWLAAVATTPGLASSNNGSLPALAAFFDVSWVGLVLGLGLLLGIAVWAWRRRPSAAQASSLALIACLLIGPLTWPGYALLLLPTFFARSWSWPLRVAAVLLVIGPALSQPAIWLVGLAGVSVHQFAFGAALLLVLAGLVREAVGAKGSDGQPKSEAVRADLPLSQQALAVMELGQALLGLA